jgi:hypothetical protein
MLVAGTIVAILQHESGHAELVEPLGNLFAFMIHRQVHITATGTNDDGAACCILRFGAIHKQHRLVFRFGGGSTGRAIFPQRNSLRLGGV